MERTSAETSQNLVSSLKDLPDVGYFVDDFVKKIDVDEDTYKNLKAWSLLDKEASPPPTGHPIILLFPASAQKDKSIIPMAKAKSRKEGFEIKAVKYLSENFKLDAKPTFSAENFSSLPSSGSGNSSGRLEISSTKDLPPSGYPIENFAAKIKDTENAQEICAWSVLARGENIPATGTPIILIVSERIKKDNVLLSSIRSKSIKEKFIVESTREASHEAIKSIIEYNPTTESIVQDENNKQIEFFNEVLGVSLREKISDIHFEKRTMNSDIRLRKHGELNPYKSISADFGRRVCAVIFNVLGENKDVAFKPSEYQAASINYRLQGTAVKIRYQSLPVYPDDSFDVVLRVLPLGEEEEGTPQITQLGYSASQEEELFKIVKKPVGALVIAGTTGSGKSTTLKNLLMIINETRQYRSKIYTVEDPPEYKIPRVSQIPVVRSLKASEYTNYSPFSEPLVATMRADPDVLMIGEVRDIYTGDGLKKATQSGHQVLTTIHASSALGVVERLADFSITPSVMGSPEFLNGLIYQKLLPVLCDKCHIKFTDKLDSVNVTNEDRELKSRIEQAYGENIDSPNMNIYIRNHKGCSNCKGIGITGRTVCAEIIAPDFTLLKLFRDSKSIEAKAYWRSLSDNDLNSENMKGKTVLEHALHKMRKGVCSPYDVESVLGYINGAVVDREVMLNDEATRMYFNKDNVKESKIFGNNPSSAKQSVTGLNLDIT